MNRHANRGNPHEQDVPPHRPRLGRHPQGLVRTSPARRQLGHHRPEFSGRPGDHGAAARPPRPHAGRLEPGPLRRQVARQRRRRRHLARSRCASLPAAAARGHRICVEAGPVVVVGIHRRRPRNRMGRQHPGRPVQEQRLRRQLAIGRCAVAASRTRRLVRRRLPRAGHPFHLPAPAASAGTAGGLELRRRLGDKGRRRQLAGANRRHAGPLHAARAGRKPQRPGPAPHRALRRPARCAVVPAPWRHLAQRRRRRQLAGGEGALVQFRLCRCRAPA
jgi:hypothetical protein